MCGMVNPVGESTNELKRSLSVMDLKCLERLDAKWQIVRDCTASVATGRSTGFYLFGNGGVGKSHNVIAELRRHAVPFKVFNSRMTGRGLFDTLRRYPSAIHVLEDMEHLFNERSAVGVLRSSLWGQRVPGRAGPMERLVTWTTNKTQYEFWFTGGLIFTANRPFPDRPELDAIKTRIAYLHLEVDDAEMVALMRNVALEGYASGEDVMTAEECGTVCDFVVNESIGLNRSFDMRLLTRGFNCYLQWRECDCGSDWQDFIAALVRERPVRFREPPQSSSKREMQKNRELQLAKELAASELDRHERVRRFVEGTGKSPATYYRRVEQLAEQLLPSPEHCQGSEKS